MKVDFELPEWAEPFTAAARYKVAYGGRGSTKSWTFARIIAFRASIEPLRVLCARETQKAIAESVHEVLKDQIAAIGLADQYEFKADSIEHKVTGSRFVYTGLKQHTAANLKSYENFDICWVAEAHKVSKVSWDILEPTIRKAGSEFWIDLNPELDTDETYDRFVLNPPKGAIVAHVNWRDNPWWNDILEQQRLRTKLRDPDGYENIWEGKPRAAIEGAIYAQELDRLQREGRFTSVKHDPLLKTHTVWDLGWNDQTVILHVNLSKDSVGQLTPAGYAIDTKHLSTQVRISDGGTVMVGGILARNQQDAKAGVPKLASWPVVGWLFGNRAQQNSRRELLVFITPKILDERDVSP